jgi:hypothetical protein
VECERGADGGRMQRFRERLFPTFAGLVFGANALFIPVTHGDMWGAIGRVSTFLAAAWMIVRGEDRYRLLYGVIFTGWGLQMLHDRASYGRHMSPPMLVSTGVFFLLLGLGLRWIDKRY